MARIFINSTIIDLREYRQAVYISLRRLGHQSFAMEEYVASDTSPLQKCILDVQASDLIINIIGWSYGYIPPDQKYSITEILIREAQQDAIPCLVFFVSEDAPWPAEYIDKDKTNILRFRQNLSQQYDVSYFKTSDELGRKAAVSLHRWIAMGASEPPTIPPVTVEAEDVPGPEVFLSYAHEDITVAESLANRIVQERWSVFWDRHIPVGLTFDDIIEAALDGAKCVVVLWSPASRNSDWVRVEATEGAERKILAPALIAQTKIPLRFRRIQAANLIDWNPNAPDTPGMKALISGINRFI